ncbi:MAG: type II toxin-antitoxin system Phd/YefM family antitoxin [Treponema sp.]|nr:type II toxin-antitoxin system Phd/YefM family antitoxin [Treponema sp.]
MPQIKPITDLRNTTEISELCNRTNEPVFITKNGYGDLVVMSMKAYEDALGTVDVLNKLAAAQKQKDEGQIVSAENVFGELHKKYEF